MRPDMPRPALSSQLQEAQGNVSRSSQAQLWANHLPKALQLLKRRKVIYAKEKKGILIILLKRVLKPGIRSLLKALKEVLFPNMLKMQLDLKVKILTCYLLHIRGC